MDLAHFWNTSGAYEINQSLRFNPTDSARLYRTLAASQTRTYSFWYKYANLSGGNMYLFHHKNSSDTNYLGVRSGGSPSENQWQTLNQGSSFTEIASSRKYRDPSAWQHVVWKCTSTNVTMYVNGIEFASAGGANTSLSGGTLEIGARGSAEYFGGYIAEFHFVDGTAYNPSDFGETDPDTGAWIPKRFGGTYGANGVYLKFDPTATNGVGHDHSGNGNNFTATGFTTSGTGTDVMSDTPTTNYPTLNPLNPAVTQLTNGNLDYSGSSYEYVRSTQVMYGDKYYFEVTTSDANINVGIMDVATAPSTITALGSPVGYGIKSRPPGPAYTYKVQLSPATDTSISPQMAANDVLGFSVDLVNGTLAVSRNGSSTDWGTLFTGIDTTKSFYVYAGHESSVSSTAFQINFGQRAFAYTPPTGYKALNTANLPEPTIKDGGEYFDTKLYTGSGGSQSLTGLGFQPELVWIKARSTASSHGLYDAVRGVGKVLQSNSTSAEQNYGSYGVTSFDATGFSVNDLPGYGVNDSGVTYAAWCWDAGGAGSSNTAGTITSTVSANATAGFSIVTYTGNATAGATVGHGLGVAPSMIICKRRENNATGTSGWQTYHASLGATKVVYLDKTDSVATDSAPWNNTAPTSTVFTLGNSPPGNPNGDKVVAYCFSEVAGYSKFGSYTGNGSSDGPFVFTNFRVKWLIVKRTDSTADWYMFDAVRNTYNPLDAELDANLSIAETTAGGATFDFLSNGFKLRRTGNAVNNSGGNYIFAAFAENPFKYANAR